MIHTIAILLLFLTVTLSMGGGLYEILVIYPNWKHDVDPRTLRNKLELSGMMNAAKRFWPLVSPAQVLLSMVNIVMACLYHGPALGYWLAAAIAIFINRVFTFSYFIPVMIQKIMQPEKIEAGRLKAIVKQWMALSPLRLIPEFVAWGLLVVALMHM
ncbi:MAG: hypothetical protein JSU01_23455 [Bacteroidetes bacterium]|nr:hypothetical protein [Bacteroidota bacterium]